MKKNLKFLAFFGLMQFFLFSCSDDSSKSEVVPTSSGGEFVGGTTVRLFPGTQTFTMGPDINSTTSDLSFEVTLKPFELDKFEVTVSEYEQCLKAKKCAKAVTTNEGNPGSKTTSNDSCNLNFRGRGNHPINCVTWTEANNYCEFAGKRLPTEAEWEITATWNKDEGKKQDTPTRDAVISCNNAVIGNSVSEKKGCGARSTWPVGEKPVEINGTYDMAGNVQEWVADYYAAYDSRSKPNPTGPDTGDFKVFRGLNWQDAYFGDFAVGMRRSSDKKEYSSLSVGFRCARSL